MPGLSPADAANLSAYAEVALRSMAKVLGRVEDDELNRRPLGDTTNSLASIVIHCGGVCGFWLGHVATGRPSERDRDAEFVARADRAELLGSLETTIAQVDTDLVALAGLEPRPNEMRGFLAGDQGDLSLTIHVIEELFQHLGHMEITADAIVATRN